MPRTGELQKRVFWPNSSQGENVGDPPCGILIENRIGSLRFKSSQLCRLLGNAQSEGKSYQPNFNVQPQLTPKRSMDRRHMLE
jgi:hypothetical protein